MIKAYLFLLICILGLSGAYLSSDGGLSELKSIERQLQAQKALLTSQLKENQTLERNIVVLQNQSNAIETIARQQLGFIKSDEVFIEVVDYRDYPIHKAFPKLPQADISNAVSAD